MIERKRFRVYSFLVLTILLLTFFVSLFFIIPEYGGYMIGIGVVLLCPLGLLTFREFSNNLWKRFSISDEKIQFQKTFKLIQVRWDEFDTIQIKMKLPFSVDVPFTATSISREYTKFRVQFIDQKSKKTVKSFKFHFYNSMKANQVLNLLINSANEKNKEVIVNKKPMK
ncbi:MAG: hypothetical protein ACFE8E_04510 [Candidatus Hodarchaeota archaeon]